MKHSTLLFLFIALLGCRPNATTDEPSEAGASAAGDAPVTGTAALPSGSADNPFFGKWASEIDPKEVVSLSATRFVSTYDNAKMVDKALAYYTQCPTQCTGQETASDYPCFMLIAEKSADPTCYAVVKVDENTLQISMIGGTGNTLRYKRVGK